MQNSIAPQPIIDQQPQTGMQLTPHGLYQIQQGQDEIIVRQEGSRKRGYRLESYKVVRGGNEGPIMVKVRNPIIGFDAKDRHGEVCSKCGKGILLTDSDMVRNKNSCLMIAPLLMCVFWPLMFPCLCTFCCYMAYKRRLCTNCNEEYPGKLCLTEKN